MLNLGFTELLLIFIVVIVVVGPERLPGMLRSLGKTYGKLRRTSDEFRRAIMFEADREEAQKRAERFRKRREEARQLAEEARREAEEQAAAFEGGDAPAATDDAPGEPNAEHDEPTSDAEAIEPEEPAEPSVLDDPDVAPFLPPKKEELS